MPKTQSIPKPIYLTTRVHVVTAQGKTLLHSHNWMILNGKRAA